MSAVIVVDDGGGPVVGSVDRDNTYIGTLFTLSNQNDTGILAWEWTLIDKPIGSAAALSASATPTVTFTPDVPGTYLVRLKTFTDLAATVLDDADEEVVGVRFAAPNDWRIPAATETTQLDAARGWATAVEEALRDLQASTSGDVQDTRQIISGTGLTGGGDLSADRTLNVVANADGSIIANANDVQVGILATDAQHGVRGGGTQHALAIAAGAAGFLSGTDKSKLDALPTFAQSIVVGNSTAGDTVYDCDYLDVGNGAQLALAIAAANAANVDVWVRPGIYDFNVAGGPVAPITVNVPVRGAGNGQTAIRTRNSGDQGVFGLGPASIEDIIILVRKPTAATAGSTAIITQSGGRLARVRIEFDAWDAGGAANTTIRDAIEIINSGSILEDVVVFAMPSLTGYGETGDSNAFHVSGALVNEAVKFARCYSLKYLGDTLTLGTADNGFWIESDAVILVDCIAENPRKYGVFIQGSAVCVSRLQWALDATLTATGMSAVRVEPTTFAFWTRVTEGTFRGASLGLTTGVDMVASGGGIFLNRSVIANNAIDSCVTGVNLAIGGGAVGDKNIFIGNQISTYTTAIITAGDTNTDFGHNAT